MKTTYGALALAAAAKVAYAHTTVYAVWINGVDQGLGNSDSGYIRSPPNNDPVKDVTSTDITCNVNNVQVAKTLEVAAGDVVTFEWHHNSRDASDDIIASSHKGPVMTYIAPEDKGGNGTNWVKLAEEGYNASDDTWAVDNLIANDGKHNVTIPDIAAGNYLLRPEIIALHEASNVGGAQFYMECVQVKVTGSGSTSLPSGVSLPGAYSATDAGIEFNIYGDFSTYPIPGPTVWDGASSGASATQAASSVAATSAAAAVSTPVAASSAAAAVQSSSVAVVQSSTPVAAAASPSASATADDEDEYDCDDDEEETTSSAVAVAATSPATTPAAVTPSSAAAAGGNYISTTTEVVYVTNVETTTVTVTAA